MDNYYETIIDQNTTIISLLERIADKLDILDDLKSTLESIEGELQWPKELSTASEIIKSIERLESTVVDSA